MFEIGNTLREARLRRGLDVADCEAATKIRAKYLRALEEEQFEVLPGTTYVKGFLRTYAEFLELDGRLVLDEYESRFIGRQESQLGDADAVRRRAHRRRNREGRVLAIAAATVLVAATGIWVGFADHDGSGGGGEAGPQEGTVTTLTPQNRAITLRFTPVGDTTVVVEVRQDGPGGTQILARERIDPGRTREVAARPPIWVAVGGTARVSLDGSPVTVPPDTDAFRILAGGVIEPSPGP